MCPVRRIRPQVVRSAPAVQWRRSSATTSLRSCGSCGLDTKWPAIFQNEGGRSTGGACDFLAIWQWFFSFRSIAARKSLRVALMSFDKQIWVMNFQMVARAWHTRARERSARVCRPVLPEIPVFKIKIHKDLEFSPRSFHRGGSGFMEPRSSGVLNQGWATFGCRPCSFSRRT
jgi:hypothetical protein